MELIKKISENLNPFKKLKPSKYNSLNSETDGTNTHNTHTVINQIITNLKSTNNKNSEENLSNLADKLISFKRNNATHCQHNNLILELQDKQLYQLFYQLYKQNKKYGKEIINEFLKSDNYKDCEELQEDEENKKYYKKIEKKKLKHRKWFKEFEKLQENERLEKFEEFLEFLKGDTLKASINFCLVSKGFNEFLKSKKYQANKKYITVNKKFIAKNKHTLEEVSNDNLYNIFSYLRPNDKQLENPLIHSHLKSLKSKTLALGA